MEARRPKRKSNDWEGIVHEFTFSTFRRRPFLSDPEFREVFLDKLAEARKRHGFLVWAYVVMPEHVHLLIPPRGAKVAQILRAVKQPVTQRIVAKLQREDPARLLQMTSGRIRGNSPYSFWQSGGGYDRDIDEANEVWGAIEYIHLNPVRRGLVERAEDWPWSSARNYHQMPPYGFDVDICQDWPR